MDILKPNKLH